MVATTTFISTPFIIPEISDRFSVSLGLAGLLSTSQVGAFALVSFVSGRLVRSSPRLLRWSIALFVIFNVVSALVPWFWALLGVRVLAGGAAGMMTWIAWADAASEPRRLSDIAAAGPIAAIIGAPLFSWLADLSGDNGIYLLMAGLALVPLMLPIRLLPMEPAKQRRISPSRSNRVLLVMLGVATLGGSSLFVYTAAAAGQLSGLSTTAASGAYSLNAVGALAGSRLSRRGTVAWPWLGLIMVAILSITFIENGPAFYLAMLLWGFSFWMAIPRVLRLIARRSFSPDERIGDAQAGMAVGRAIGPAAGAGFAASEQFTGLGLMSAAGLAISALGVALVERFRRRGGDAHVKPKIPMTRWRLPGSTKNRAA